MKYFRVGLIASLVLSIVAISVAGAAMSKMLGTIAMRGDNYSQRYGGNSRSPALDYVAISPDGAVATQDAARVTNPTTQTTASNVINVHEVNGEYVMLVLRYDAGLTGITNPAGALFGRVSPSGTWIRLRTLGGADQITFTCDSTNDVTDGTYKYTSFSTSINIFDRMGCDEFTWGTETALNGTGTKSNARVLFKPL